MKSITAVLTLLILFSGCIQDSGDRTIEDNKSIIENSPTIPPQTPEGSSIRKTPTYSPTPSATISSTPVSEKSTPPARKVKKWPPDREPTSVVLESNGASIPSIQNKTLPFTPGEIYDGVVTEVIDGDSIQVFLANGESKRIKMLGVEVPSITQNIKLHYFDDITDLECLEKWGVAAKQFTTSKLNGETCRVVFDEVTGVFEVDKELLAYVYINGEDIGETLIEKGYGIATSTNHSKRELYVDKEENSIEDRRGIWSCPSLKDLSIERPVVGFYTVYYDAEGVDHTNLNDEYIVIKNYGNSPVLLSNWSIKNHAGEIISLPKLYLNAGETLTVYSGSGVNTDNEFFLQSAEPFWDNEDDSAGLYDSEGELVDFCSW